MRHHRSVILSNQIDEMISALKQKLEIMESFHCSSSSFDALNSFQGRRNSSVVVIAENDSIPSPTFKSFRNLESSTKTSKRGSNIFQKMNKLKSIDQSLNCSNYSLDLQKQRGAIPSTFSVESPLSIDKGSKIHKFFSFITKIFRIKGFDRKKLASITRSAASFSSECIVHMNSSYSYEKIISGQIPLESINMEKVEVI